MDFIVEEKVLGVRTREEWRHDFIEHKGFYPDDRELDSYIEDSIEAKLRFFAEDLTKATNDLLVRSERLKRDIESNSKSAFITIAGYREEYEAKTKELIELADSLRS